MIKIIIADDHNIFRESLRILLEKRANYDVLADAADGQTAVQLTIKMNPDIVIMDISMKGLNGIEAIKQIIKKNRFAKIIALSMHSDSRYIIEAFKAGAKGYLLKDCVYKELVQAIEAVYGDKHYLSPNISNVIVDHIKSYSKNNRSIFVKLTSRELQALQLLAEGKSTKEIASILDVSVKTIETYRLHIMEKLDIHTVAELTKYAIREGLTSVD